MILLHSISKELGRGEGKRVVLDEVDCLFDARSHYAILGQRGAGKTTLLHLISGALFPSRGWVERYGIVSTTTGLVKYGTGLTTPRQLSRRLAKVYVVDPQAVAEFVSEFAELGKSMDMPVRSLTREGKQRLGFALFYAFPCDFYLYDGVFSTKLPLMADRVREAYLQRRAEAGMILVTSNIRTAKAFGGRGGIIFDGKLSLYDTAEHAIELFEQLPHQATPRAAVHDEDRKDYWSDDSEF